MILSKEGRETRALIIDAFFRLGIPREEWTLLVGPDPVECHQTWVLASYDFFKPPPFQRFDQSPEEWKVLADASWQKYRDELMERWQGWVFAGVDQPIPSPKQRTHSGKASLNAGFDERYEWAALRLKGLPWKEIACRYRSCDSEKRLQKAEEAIRKAGTELLRIAGLNRK